MGKWHLGDKPGYRPLERGFDRFWGFYSGGHGYRGTRPDNPIIDGFNVVDTQDEYLSDAITGRASSYILANQNRPFFLMVTLQRRPRARQPRPLAREPLRLPF